MRDTAKPVSEENVAIIRKGYEGVNNRDFSFMRRLWADDVELVLPPEFPGTQTARGPEGFLSAMAELEEAVKDIRYEPEELLDVEDRVLATVRFTAIARHTDIAMDTLVYWLYTIRDGKVVKMVVYLDRAEALEALGSSASPPSLTSVPDL